MRVYGGYDPMTARLAVVFEPRHGEVARISADGGYQIEAVSPGANRTPTLWLDMDTATELGRFLYEMGHSPKPPDDLTPTKQHLADAVAVRDRLLAIVERN